ncbi:MAG: GC-type dockerin domain-anchored protein [Phycisphaerales bacterium]
MVATPFMEAMGGLLVRTCAASGVMLVVAMAASRADVLPIVNPGFEQLNVTLRAGEQTNGAGGGVTPVTTRWVFPFPSNGNLPQSGVIVPGWRTYIPQPGSGVLAGVLRPDVLFGGTPWMSGYSGSHVIAAQAAEVSQTLNVRWQPSTTYTLRFLAGIGITDSEYAPLIGLLATPDLTTLAFLGTPGVTSVARMPLVNIQQQQFGTMLAFSFSFTTPAALPPGVAGHYIAISFVGSDGIPRMCYDDFGLEAVSELCYANCDLSATPPVLNVADYVCFLNAFAAGAASANCDGSTTPPVLNVNDFICYSNSFAAGCP